MRAFEARQIEPAAVDSVLRAMLSGPSAGFVQALDVVVLDLAQDVEQFWSLTFTSPEHRSNFRWQGLFNAPVLMIPVVSAGSYLARYSEPDKRASGLMGEESWTVPYWWVDGGMGVMAGLLAAVDEGLGALFFGLFEHEREVLQFFGVPDDRRSLGVIALGHPAIDEPGRSASTRSRRETSDAVHRSRW